jgi:pimeloyl-ACP methyl ester carboxylesterase
LKLQPPRAHARRSLRRLRDRPPWPRRQRDRAEYSIEREFEDVAAVVDSIDEPASLFGHSYGATVALGEMSPDWAPEGTERIRVVLPSAQVALLPGQGHMATVTAPELVADELARFLGG